MLKKLNDFLAGIPATIAAGLFLLLDLVPHLMEEFGGSAMTLNFLPFDPAWMTVIISGIPMVYLAVWRMIHNPGISKISSARFPPNGMAFSFTEASYFPFTESTNPL